MYVCVCDIGHWVRRTRAIALGSALLRTAPSRVFPNLIIHIPSKLGPPIAGISRASRPASDDDPDGMRCYPVVGIRSG